MIATPGDPNDCLHGNPTVIGVPGMPVLLWCSTCGAVCFSQGSDCWELPHSPSRPYPAMAASMGIALAHRARRRRPAATR